MITLEALLEVVFATESTALAKGKIAPIQTFVTVNRNGALRGYHVALPGDEGEFDYMRKMLCLLFSADQVVRYVTCGQTTEVERRCTYAQALQVNVAAQEDRRDMLRLIGVERERIITAGAQIFHDGIVIRCAPLGPITDIKARSLVADRDVHDLLPPPTIPKPPPGTFEALRGGIDHFMPKDDITIVDLDPDLLKSPILH